MTTATIARTAAAPESVVDLRRRFRRHRDACLFVATRAEYDAALAAAARRIGPVGDLSPSDWVAAIEEVVLPFHRCRGTGFYQWAGASGGRPVVRRDTCYHCGGNGTQTLDDAHRNRVHMRHYIRQACGC